MNIAIWIAIIAAAGTVSNALINFFKKPLDKWWDKRLEEDRTENKPQSLLLILLTFLEILFGFILPALSIIYAFLYMPFDKVFVLLIAVDLFILMLLIVFKYTKKFFKFLVLLWEAQLKTKDQIAGVQQRQIDLTETLVSYLESTTDNLKGDNKKLKMLQTELELFLKQGMENKKSTQNISRG